MRFCWAFVGALLLCIATSAAVVCAQTAPSAGSSSSSAKHGKASPVSRDAGIDAGAISNGVYRNKSLGFSCRIPEGWVLRTDEMNAPQEEPETPAPDDGAKPASSVGAKVLLAAFSRPPEARGEEVNASILIAAESASAYPGLKDAAQYFDPITEVAKAQGFEIDEDPYEVAIGSKVLVRGDFHKDVGTRVMRQSTLAMLAHGYAVSITVIGGTEDEVQELIDGLEFGAPRPKK
ncbi:MAG TPA: hypothetical protein VMD99_07515 [Terriglobales bacterium]|nr:hypothetical protein [Terriglobales bacterium]